MGKMFKDLTELNRTFTQPITGARFEKKMKERDAEGFRLKDFVFTAKKMIRLTTFSALFLEPDGLYPVRMCEAFGSQDFYLYATPFEQKNSVLCTHANHLSNVAVQSGESGQSFMPIVMDTGDIDVYVVGHTGFVMGHRLVLPLGLGKQLAGDPETALSRGVPFYVIAQEASLPDGFGQLGIADKTYQVVVKPDGQVTRLHQYSNRSGLKSANWVIDLVVAPAALALGKSGIRMAKSLMESMPVGKAPVLAGPTRQVANDAAAAAELSAARLARTTSPGMAVSTGGAFRAEHLGRRTLIMGDDMAHFRGLIAHSHPEQGFYDVIIHGDSSSFLVMMKVNGKEVWTKVSVSEVANAVRPHLAAGDKIRLLACKVGREGGPAQQLANELNRTVWAAPTTLDAVPTAVRINELTARKSFGKLNSFVPDAGEKFSQFVPQRGAATLSGKGGKEPGNVLFGEIRAK